MKSCHWITTGNCIVKIAMKKKISTLKNQVDNNVVINVESLLYMEKSVVIVKSTYYALSATI